MKVTRKAVSRERDWIRDRSDVVVSLVNEVRSDLAEVFETDVDSVTSDQYRQEVDAVFADGDLAVNVAALVRILRELDVEADYPGFVVDEILGRELAGAIAGGQPLRMLGEATFHYADLLSHAEGDEPAGIDDLDAALAAGFQTRLPGWNWTEEDSPFSARDRE